MFLYYNVRFRFRICPKTVFCGSDTVLSPPNVGVPTDHGFLNIYGLSNRFYCSCTLVGVLTIPRFWDKF
ncbi:hypothetical protein LEP1GSC133_2404 [Leptospira borgpetersenii serovar Pomona str. 200901868]|uniref:Uncharacterized protein n=1 Tax=Leptospira borgpetersenii serovar Pomona str. 200901868 TaxID=1192866 RepID=M6W9W0_LEPBO|nr:hypothetical protein LEP1GSC133_2404 [Leptospira borgpetersenii serovar Pomona str. 200901868]